MDVADFVSTEFGELHMALDVRGGLTYFRPAKMPRDLILSPATIMALSRADAALGRLSGVGHLLKDPSILVKPYLAREAVSSSRIEGTVASLSDYLQARASEEPSESDDIAGVYNYQLAIDHGVSALKESQPLGIQLAAEMHEILLTGSRGQNKTPGKLRQGPVWIGSATDAPETAAFVPPIGSDLDDSLSDWEMYLHEQVQLPVLIRCGLMHYQFETIHPFLDGNGRVGRLLILLMLLEQQTLQLPLLYISSYLEKRRREYYERLQAVRERGEIQEWLQYFLTAVERQADDAYSKAEKIVRIRERYRAELRGTKSRASEVVDLLFENSFITVRRVERALGVTNQGARNLLEGLEKRGWIVSLGPSGRSGRITWVCLDIFHLLANAPQNDSSTQQSPPIATHS